MGASKSRTTLLLISLFALQIVGIRSASAATIVMDTLNNSSCVNNYQPPNQWAHRFISGGGTITQIRMLVPSTTNWATSKIQIRAENGSVPGAVLATFDAVSATSTIVTYSGSYTSNATGKFWVNPYSPSSPLAWCYFQAGGGTTTSASGWSFDPTNTSSSKGLAFTSDYNSWSVGGGGFQIQYEFQTGVAVDSTPPTFTSPTTISVSENSTLVGTVVVNESSTITVDSGDDKLKFNVTRDSDTSSVLSFISPPNFEAPTDVGSNNSYQVILKAIDGANNSRLETFTVNVTDVIETSSLSSFSLAGNVRTAIYKTQIVITAVSTVPAKITFKWKGKVIAGCASKLTSGAAPNATASCTWAPSNRGVVNISAHTVPINTNYTGATVSMDVLVLNRSGSR